jgi:hypothetical protein
MTVPAPAGRGASAAVQDPADRVSINPCWNPEVSLNLPSAAQEPSAGQDRLVKVPNRYATPLDSGAFDAVHEAPDRVSTSACSLPEESKYSPIAVQDPAAGQDTTSSSAWGGVAESAGRGVVVSVQAPPDKVSIRGR